MIHIVKQKHLTQSAMTNQPINIHETVHVGQKQDSLYSMHNM